MSYADIRKKYGLSEDAQNVSSDYKEAQSAEGYEAIRQKYGLSEDARNTLPDYSQGQTADGYAAIRDKYGFADPSAKSDINAWIDQTNKLITDTNNHFSAWNNDTAKDAELQTRSADLLSMADHWRTQYAGNTDALASVDSVVNTLTGVSEHIKTTREKYSKFDSQEAYEKGFYDVESSGYAYADYYSSLVGKVRDIDTVQKELDEAETELEALRDDNPTTLYKALTYQSELGAEVPPLGPEITSTTAEEVATYGKDVLTKEEELKKKIALLKAERFTAEYVEYLSLQNSEDFAAGSQYVFTGKTKKRLSGPPDTYDEDTTYEYVNNKNGYREEYNSEDATMHRDSPFYDGVSIMEEAGYDYLIEDEIKVYNYLYATKGKKAANGFLDFLTPTLEARMRDATEKSASAFADEHPFLASASTFALVPWESLAYVGQVADYIEDGKIDENASYNSAIHMTNAVRGKVSEKIQNSGEWGAVGSFAYETGMGLGDFLITTAIAGGNETLALSIMGTSAAANTTIEAKDRGLSDNQAFALGTIAGAAEIITEKIGMDALFDTALKGKSPLIYLLKTALSEAAEEPASDLINYMADIYIAGDKSQFELAVKAYMENENLSEGEATAKATIDQVMVLAKDSLGGLISGGILGGGRLAVDYVSKSAKKKATAQPKGPAQAVDSVEATNLPTAEKNAATPSVVADNNAEQSGTAQATPMSVYEEALALGTNAAADPVAAAVDDFRQTGTVTNKRAREILNNSKALQTLRDAVGLDLPYTDSGRRNAIKEAVARLAKQTAVDTTPKTDYDNTTTQGGDSYAQGLQQHDRAGSSGNPAKGMAGVQQSDGSATARQQEHGGVAGHSRVLRVSDELQNAQKKRGTPTYPVRDTTATPEEYELALTAGRESDEKNGWCVTPKTAQELRDENVRTFMNESGTVGAGIAPDGDIVAVFKNKNGGPRKALDTLMPIVIEQGGDRLDCYGDGLVDVYSQYGFIPVARVEFAPEHANPGWDSSKNTPWIYFMIHNGDTAVQVVEKKGSYPCYTQAQLDALPTYGKEDYDAAMEYRNGLLDSESSNTPATQETTATETPGLSAHPSPTDSVGAAPSGFDPYSDLQYQYGNKPDRSGTVRDINVPNRDSTGQRVSDYAANIFGHRITSDDMVETLEQLIADGAFGAETKHLDNIEETAIKSVKHNREKSYAQVQTAIAQGKYSDDLLALAQVLYADAESRMEFERAGDIAVMAADIARVGGRILNVAKMTSRLTPDGQLAARIAIADSINEKKNASKSAKQAPDVEISDETKQAFRDVANAGQTILTDAKRVLDQTTQKDVTAAAETAAQIGERAGKRAGENAAKQSQSLDAGETAAPTEQQLYDAIMEFIKSKTSKAAKTSRKQKTAALDALSRYYADSSDFTEAWTAARNRAEAEVADDPKAYGILRQFLDTGGMAQDVADSADIGSVSRKAVREASKGADVDLQQLIAESLEDRQAAFDKIREYVLNKYSLDAAAAQQLTQQLQDAFFEELAQRQSKRLLAMFGEKQTTSITADASDRVKSKFRQLYNMGAFTNDAFISREALKQLFGQEGLTLSDEVLEQYGKVSDARKAAIDQQIITEIAQQMPGDFRKSLNKWRYGAMLANPSTHIKNLAGNAGQFIIQHGLKDNLAAVIESAADKASGGKLQRTKAVLNPLSANDRDLVNMGMNDYGTVTKNNGDVAKRIKNGGKYDSALSEIEQQRRVMKLNNDSGSVVKQGVNKALSGVETVIDANSALMDTEDAVFGRTSYALALAGYMKANGLTEITEEARAYAIRQAQEATFHDDSWLYQKVKGIKGNAVGDVIVPFTKTPANVTSRSIEYSPVSIVQGAREIRRIARGKTQTKNGTQITGAQAIDHLSKGIIGSAMWGAGAWLASQGLIRVVGSGSEEKREYEELMGFKDFTICIGGEYYDADFLTPAIIPLYTGAAIYETFVNMTDGGATWKDVVEAMYSVTDPILSSSMMSSLDGIMYAIRRMDTLSSGELAGTLVTEFCETALSQMVPSLLKRVAAASDNVIRQTYEDPDNPLSSITQSMQSAIPGLRDDLKAKRDIWGQEILQNAADGNDPLSWLWRVITPSRQADAHETAIDTEILRLQEAGYDALPAATNSKTVTVKGEKVRLTQEQYEVYEETEGKASYTLAEKLIESDVYKSLSDKDKESALNAAYDYANEIGKEAAIPDYERDLPEYLQGLSGTGNNVAETILRHVAVGTTDKYTGLSIQDATKIDDLLDGLQDSPRETKSDGSTYTNVLDIQKIEAVAGADSFLTEQEQKTVMADILDDSAYAKYEQVLALGMDTDDYAASYRLFLDLEGSNKKDRTIAQYQKEFGISYSSAKALYEIYSPPAKKSS